MFQKFQIDDLAKFPQTLSNLLNTHREKIEMITNSDTIEYAEIMKPLQDLDEELAVVFTPLSNLNSVMNSEETQNAYEQSIPILSKFSSQMAQNTKLFDKIEQIETDDLEQRAVLANEIRDFVLSGIKLPKPKKDRLEEIALGLSELSNEFSQNLLNATNAFELIIENREDVEGIPKSDLESALVQIDGKSVYKFTLQIPSYLAYMTYGPNRKYREIISKAYSTRAPDNGAVINKILSLKYEKANILGFSSYAEYALESRDAPSQESVISFLESLSSSAMTMAQSELSQIQEYAKRVDGVDDLQGYDLSYYSEKLKKEKFQFDDTMTKPYFEQSRVLGGLLDTVSELFLVTFISVNVPVWHECVKVFDIYENDTLSGRIYFDLEARPEKRGGAWMSDWETHYIDSNKNLHLPSAFVVCNFSATTSNNPSLLRHDDVVTLFHEMGHAIHHLFSKCHERSISGINGVAWDVIEFPSQFLENFAYEPAILKRFGFHHETSSPIPDTLLAKIKDTKNYQAALSILRQVEFSLFDFKLHQKLYQNDGIQILLDKIREDTSLPQVAKYNKFQHGFSHIFAGGYAAGYYSYKWAEVLSADALLSCLDPKTGFDKKAAKGYKKYILSNGAKRSMSQLYKEWLGREASSDSLLKLYDIAI